MSKFHILVSDICPTPVRHNLGFWKYGISETEEKSKDTGKLVAETEAPIGAVS